MVRDKRNSPIVSIVTPSYNCGEYIEKTILNIFNQDYPHIEHIIIDGGSNDDTLKILNKHNDKVTWISEPDNGMYDAINKGFEKTKGDIFTYINADDLYYNINTVSTVVNEFLDNDAIDFTYGHCEFVDIDRKKLFIYKSPKFYRKYALALPRALFQQPTCFWKKTVHTSFDSSMTHCADAKFFRYLMKNYNGKRINDIIAKFMIRADCISFKHPERMRLEGQLVYEDVIKNPPSIYLVIFDFIYRTVLLNFRANVKRKILKYKGEPYL